MLKLRPDQEEALEAVRAHLRRGRRRVLLQAPTGFGKTVVASTMAKTAVEKGKRVWMLVHRRELVRQVSKAFTKCDLQHGIVSAGYPSNRFHAAQVCSIPTLVNRLDLYQAPNVIIFDEAHHISAGSWAKIAQAFPEAVQIGLSATPIRLDGVGLGEFFDELVEGPPVKWLIEHGALAPYRLLAPASNLNLASVHRTAGDYNKRELDDAVAASTITGDAVEHYCKHAMGTKALMFHVSIARSVDAVERFTAAGITAKHVDGETDPIERDAAIEAFENGDLMVMSNVGLFGEGTDLAGVQTLIDCAPSMSLGSVMQRWGRVLRPAPGKVALILDHAGNSGEKHGYPDTERQWSLEGRTKRKKKDPEEITLRRCPVCMATLMGYVAKCDACGHVFESQGREVEEVAGELQEVINPAVEAMERKREQQRARSEDELVEIGRQRGMKRPHLWARHVMRARGRPVR
jgi:DNA repair protein RadD